MSSHATKKKFSFVGVVVALAVVALGCEVPDPTPNQVVSVGWGSDIAPQYADIPYVDEAYMGCPGNLTDNAPCQGAQTLDIYPAVVGGNKGTIVHVHGGAFKEGSKYPLAYSDILSWMTHNGWNLISVDYRLVSNDQFLFPTGIQDVAAALRWVETNGSAYGLNTSRLVVAGHSAGGTLAALAGTAANSELPEFAGIPSLSGWVSIAGIMDYSAGDMSSLWTSVWAPNLATQGAIASPVTWWDTDDPLGYIAHGDLDNIVEIENVNRMVMKSKGTERIQVDIVDRFDDGSFMPVDMRGHAPQPGMNRNHFLSWLNELPAVGNDSGFSGSYEKAAAPTTPKVVMSSWVLGTVTPQHIWVRLYQ